MLADDIQTSQGAWCGGALLTLDNRTRFLIATTTPECAAIGKLNASRGANADAARALCRIAVPESARADVRRLLADALEASALRLAAPEHALEAAVTGVDDTYIIEVEASGEGSVGCESVAGERPARDPRTGDSAARETAAESTSMGVLAAESPLVKDPAAETSPARGPTTGGFAARNSTGEDSTGRNPVTSHLDTLRTALSKSGTRCDCLGTFYTRAPASGRPSSL